MCQRGKESQLSADSTPSSIGQYKVERELAKGQGGMGWIYLARTPKGERVVLKVARERQNAALVNEAKVLGRLRHRNIVRIFTGEQHSKPTLVQREHVEGEVCLFSVLEYVDGKSLSGMQGMRPSAIIRVIREVAAALDHAHSKGVLHLDVKTGNILITRDFRRVVLIDWGTAELANEARAGSHQALFFTASYVSPERARGDPVDVRADVYSLGVVAFELLTGTLPFKKTTAKEIARAHISEPIPEDLIRKLSPQLQPVLRKALAKDPAERYATAGALAHDLAKSLPIEGQWRVAAVVTAGLFALALASYGAFTFLPKEVNPPAADQASPTVSSSSAEIPAGETGVVKPVAVSTVLPVTTMVSAAPTTATQASTVKQVPTSTLAPTALPTDTPVPTNTPKPPATETAAPTPASTSALGQASPSASVIPDSQNTKKN